MLREYYRLAKPGIVYGNLLAALAGYLCAVRGAPAPLELAGFLIGLALCIGSACVVNNWLDRKMDAVMERTKNRALVSGAVSARAALIYAGVLGVLGFALLAVCTVPLVGVVVAGGYLVYVAIYTPLKPRTYHATLAGAVSGAVPMAAGYIAGAHTYDALALALFAVMAIWQVPHFYAIALRRKSDYAAAGVPVASVVLGDRATIALTRAYIVLFAPVSLVPALLGATGYVYVAVLGGVSLWWLGVALRSSADVQAWARGTFIASLVVLLVLCVALALAPFLP